MHIVDLKNLNNPPSSESPADPPTGKEKNHINPQRRQFLKLILVGISAFVLGILTRSLGLSGLFSKSKKTTPLEPDTESQTEDFENYRIIKGNNQTIFIDKKTNEEVLILD